MKAETREIRWTSASVHGECGFGFGSGFGVMGVRFFESLREKERAGS